MFPICSPNSVLRADDAVVTKKDKVPKLECTSRANVKLHCMLRKDSEMGTVPDL